MGAPRTSRETRIRSGGASPRLTRMWPMIEPRVCCWAVEKTGRKPQQARTIIGRNGGFGIWFRARMRKHSEKINGLAPKLRSKPGKITLHPRLPLEREFQVELHLARIQRATRLTKVGKAHVIVGTASDRSQQEIGTVEYVKRLPF